MDQSAWVKRSIASGLNSPPSHVPSIVLTVCVGLLVAGVAMYSSPRLGAVLITVALLGIWWVVVLNLPQSSRIKSLLSGWGIFLVLGLFLAWYAHSSVDAQPGNAIQRPQSRTLDVEHYSLLVKKLRTVRDGKDASCKIEVRMGADEKEVGYAQQLRRAFTEAEWKDQSDLTDQYVSDSPVSLAIVVKRENSVPPLANAVKAAFRESGETDIQFTPGSTDDRENFVRLLVGQKPQS